MNDTIFHLQPWTPQVTKVANSVMSKVHDVVPELEILFMGAAALELPGKNDVDLDVLCDIKDLPRYTKELVKVLGQPIKIKENLTAWEFVKDGFEIDIILSDPTTSHVPEQKAVFEKLKTYPKLLEEYRKLKEAADGLPHVEYEKRKQAFFNEKISSSV